MARLIGLDVGTSGTKALMIDETGAVIATSSRPHTLQIPQPAWAEQNPEEWLQAAIECLEELGADKADGIGLTGQMHGSVFLDENGDSIRPALLWCDQRTADQCKAIEEAVGPEELRRITGNPALTGFQLPKILWLRDNGVFGFGDTRLVAGSSGCSQCRYCPAPKSCRVGRHSGSI
jgi:xylulokinase